MSKSYLPSEKTTKPFWLSLEDEDPFSNYKSFENLPQKTEILIIGSGYAGSATAYNLLQEYPELDVTLVEARTLCSGATGRNGGHLKPYGHRLYADYEKEHGPEVAAQVVNSEVEHLYEIKDLVEREKIDCDFVLTRACDVYRDAKRVENDLYAFKRLLSNPYVKAEVKNSIQLIQGDQVANLSKVPDAKICFTYPAAHVWPWKLMIGLLKIAVGKGLKLFANTSVTKVIKLDNDEYLVKTINGEIIAKKVVFCTNGYTKGLLEPFKDSIIPVKGVVTYIKPSDPSKPIPQLPNTYGLFSRVMLNSDYLINRADGGVIVGGASNLMIKPNGDYTELYDNSNDSYFPSIVGDHLKDYMKKTFSTWKNYQTTNEFTWAGIMGFTKDKFPYVGELDFIGMKNAYIVAGFSGHGMPRVYFSAKSIAKCILTNQSIQQVGGIPECYYVSSKRLTKKEHAFKTEIDNHIKSHL